MVPCLQVQRLEKETQKVLSGYILHHLKLRSETELLSVNCWISWAVFKKLHDNESLLVFFITSQVWVEPTLLSQLMDVACPSETASHL